MLPRKKTTISLIPQEDVENKIYLIRGKKVMVDRDLAALYGVETRVLNQAVQRNSDRFPDDFMFCLTKKELGNWISQIVISNREKMGLRKRPLVFTQEGIAMLSSVLHSPRAIRVNIQIMRAFVRIRELMANHKDLQKRIDDLEQNLTKKTDGNFGVYDEQFKIAVRAFSATRRGGFAVFRRKMEAKKK